MPIYAYKCESCGHQKDVLQKISDPLLTVCPTCGTPNFKKQVTAAGFQLKGSGWYVTDFRDNKSSNAAKKDKDDAGGKSGDTTAAATDSTTTSPPATPLAPPSSNSPATPINSPPPAAAPTPPPANK